MNFPVVQWLGFRVFTAVARVQNLIEELCHTLSWHNQKKTKLSLTLFGQAASSGTQFPHMQSRGAGVVTGPPRGVGEVGKHTTGVSQMLDERQQFSSPREAL